MKLIKRKSILPYLMIPLLLVACSGMGAQVKGEMDEYASAPSAEAVPMKKDRKYAASERRGEGMFDTDKAADRPSSSSDGRETGGENVSSGANEYEDVIIYEADCAVSVKNVRDSVKTVTTIAKEFGGYIDGSTSSDSYRRAVIVVRVPSKKFDQFLASLPRLGDVESREVRATNVSDEYHDLAARLVTAQRILERLNALLQKEIDMQSRIAILREIDRVTAQIESYKARIAYLKGLADYATVRITLNAESRTAVRRYIPSPFAWIRNLSPESRSITRRSSVSFPPPEGFFSLDDDFNARNGLYLYTLPGDAAGIRTGSVELYPKAEISFWKDAFAYDASNRMYKIIGQKDISSNGMTFALYHLRVSAGKFYTVAFAVSGTEIVVAEACYRDEDSFKSNRERVERFIAQGGQK